MKMFSKNSEMAKFSLNNKALWTVLHKQLSVKGEISTKLKLVSRIWDESTWAEE